MYLLILYAGESGTCGGQSTFCGVSSLSQLYVGSGGWTQIKLRSKGLYPVSIVFCSVFEQRRKTRQFYKDLVLLSLVFI